MPDYYCWLEYYWGPPVSKTIKGDELKYGDKHSHGAQPTDSQWTSCESSLIAAVAAVGNKRSPKLAPPADSVIKAGATKKTRSAH